MSSRDPGFPLASELTPAKIAEQNRRTTTLPAEADRRKDIPFVTGLIDYFPAALAAVAHLSKVGNDQHNPGQPMHWAREKSTDHANCVGRHLVDRGTFDVDGERHSTKLAWRALAILQLELEAAGAPVAPGARLAPKSDADRILGTLRSTNNSFVVEP